MQSKIREYKEQLNREVIKKMSPNERLVAYCNLTKICAELMAANKAQRAKGIGAKDD